VDGRFFRRIRCSFAVGALWRPAAGPGGAEVAHRRQAWPFAAGVQPGNGSSKLHHRAAIVGQRGVQKRARIAGATLPPEGSRTSILKRRAARVLRAVTAGKGAVILGDASFPKSSGSRATCCLSPGAAADEVRSFVRAYNNFVGRPPAVGYFSAVGRRLLCSATVPIVKTGTSRLVTIGHLPSGGLSLLPDGRELLAGKR